MIEAELNINDKLRLKTDIKISMILGLLFSFGLIICVGLIWGLMFAFGKRNSSDLLMRGLILSGLIFIPFLAISWNNIIKFIDLKRAKKLIFKTDNYRVVNKKDKVYLLTYDNSNQRIKIDKELVTFIVISQPLTIEITNLTKSLLFISHNDENLLDKLYKDKKE